VPALEHALPDVRARAAAIAGNDPEQGAALEPRLADPSSARHFPPRAVGPLLEELAGSRDGGSSSAWRMLALQEPAVLRPHAGRLLELWRRARDTGTLPFPLAPALAKAGGAACDEHAAEALSSPAIPPAAARQVLLALLERRTPLEAPNGAGIVEAWASKPAVTPELATDLAAGMLLAHWGVPGAAEGATPPAEQARKLLGRRWR